MTDLEAALFAMTACDEDGAANAVARLSAAMRQLFPEASGGGVLLMPPSENGRVAAALWGSMASGAPSPHGGIDTWGAWWQSVNASSVHAVAIVRDGTERGGVCLAKSAPLAAWETASLHVAASSLRSASATADAAADAALAQTELLQQLLAGVLHHYNNVMTGIQLLEDIKSAKGDRANARVAELTSRLIGRGLDAIRGVQPLILPPSRANVALPDLVEGARSFLSVLRNASRVSLTVEHIPQVLVPRWPTELAFTLVLVYLTNSFTADIFGMVTDALALSVTGKGSSDGEVKLIICVSEHGPKAATMARAAGHHAGLVTARRLLRQEGGDVRYSNQSGAPVVELVLPSSAVAEVMEARNGDAKASSDR